MFLAILRRRSCLGKRSRSNPLFNSRNSDIAALGLSGTIANYSAILQAYTLTCSGTGDFVQDETVYQGASLDAATFTGTVVSWDPTNGELLLINTNWYCLE